MAKLLRTIKNISDFLNTKIWRIRIDKLNKRQGFIVKQLRIFMLAIKGFNKNHCLIKASALTYFTLFSIVPVIALVFAIAKGFGYQEDLKVQIMQKFSDRKDVLTQAFDYADIMLANTHGGLIAGIGVIVLLFSVIKLLSNIEDSFNDIWGITRDRTWIRKITDYLSIMLVAPFFLILSGALTVGFKTSVEAVTSSHVYFDPVIAILLKLLAFSLIWSIFVFIYVALPNTKVTFIAGAKGGFVAALLFELLQWAYVASQVGVGQYNAIYGSFAALPLFLIWVQYSWYIMLFGSELSHSNQNVDNYELENDIINISDRYKRVIALLIANYVVKNFNEGRSSLTVGQIAKKLDLPIRLARLIIFEFTETGIFNEVKTAPDKETGFQPGISDSKLTVKYIIDKLDEKGINKLPIEDSKELAMINRLMKDMDDVLNTSKGNMLVKDLA